MWESLGKIAVIVQFLSVIPFLWTAWIFFNRSRRYKRIIKQSETTQSDNPMALIISMSGTDATNQVLEYLRKNNMEMPHRSFCKPHGITESNIPHLLSDLLKMKSEMTADGVSEVHLFVMAPVAFAVAVGAVLDNWVQVKVYHLNREINSYEYWTYLHKGFIPGLDYSALKEIANG